ncbi:hypothetical protein NQ314_017290 [Rhamnusium bicolor]|uniref:Uncharacterized protein n=1 Tax=Rhamnusium bicolor TaxID=1586634 RepID=A0AAV8WUX6_9CUCU|nr:hypothetical protein NQ314_017290 [Rhamnusium bicolor]
MLGQIFYTTFKISGKNCINLTKITLKRADQLAKEIEKISIKINASKENISLITYIISNSNLSTNVTNCLNKIKDLYTLSDSIEQGLINLESVIDENEFEHLKVQHEYHLSQYQLRKEESLENFKSSLDANHSMKIAKYESKKKVLCRKDRKFFKTLLKNDIESYKNLGTLPEMKQPKNQNSALLEEIQLDFDQNELDQFFGDKL